MSGAGWKKGRQEQGFFVFQFRGQCWKRLIMFLLVDAHQPPKPLLTRICFSLTWPLISIAIASHRTTIPLSCLIHSAQQRIIRLLFSNCASLTGLDYSRLTKIQPTINKYARLHTQLNKMKPNPVSVRHQWGPRRGEIKPGMKSRKPTFLPTTTSLLSSLMKCCELFPNYKHSDQVRIL